MAWRRIASCLKRLPSELGESDGKHKEKWANFLISRDLLYGLSTSPTNDKSGVEFYNAAQFARQFGLLELIPLPPYPSKNLDFLSRPVINMNTLEQVMSDFAQAKADFNFQAYTEFPKKSTYFDDWWKDHINTVFTRSEKIALPPTSKKVESSKAETTSATTSAKRKGVIMVLCSPPNINSLRPVLIF